MTDSTYNGWTNYETWRVNLEMCDYDGASDNDLDAYDLGMNLRDSAMDYISQEASGLALDYAQAFLENVNWREIAANMIDAYRVTEGDDCKRNGHRDDGRGCCADCGEFI